MNNLLEKVYNPDVLSCLANLSNDEVFTPPEVANKMIDLLPKELFENESTTFLDPCCKSGVFLREIMKRILNVKFPNYEEKIALINDKKMNKEKITNDDIEYEKALQNKIDWICHKQLYGISITKLTSLLSRRSLYCSKNANSKYSISRFDTDYGHIMFVDMKHTFKNGKCIYCGASESEYGEEKRGEELESHAYQFIHDDRILEEFNMRFDVIIGNPPYQLKTGGAQAQAIPLYNKFVLMAKELNPNYLTMIIPSRWFTGGMGLQDFRKEMLNDRHIRIIHDYFNEKECFPGVEIKGGVCYFLWDKNVEGDCKIITHDNGVIVSKKTRPLLEADLDIFIRYNEAIDILHKIRAKKEQSLSEMISSQRPFGFPTNYSDYVQNESKSINTKLYGNHFVGYIQRKKVEKNVDWIDDYKVLTPKAIGSGRPGEDWIKPILADKNSVCTETYIVLGHFKNVKEANNLISYTQTKFFHFLLTLKKNTQDALQQAYFLIPMQDFSEPWSDKKLYKKYKLTKDEINYIESMIKPMSNDEEDN